MLPKLGDVHCAVPTILPPLNGIKLNSTMNELNIFTPFLRFQHDIFLEENKAVFGLLPTAPWLAARCRLPLARLARCSSLLIGSCIHIARLSTEIVWLPAQLAPNSLFSSACSSFMHRANQALWACPNPMFPVSLARVVRSHELSLAHTSVQASKHPAAACRQPAQGVKQASKHAQNA